MNEDSKSLSPISKRRKQKREEQQRRRLDDERRTNEQERNTLMRKHARQDEQRRKKEQECNTLSRRRARENEEHKHQEQNTVAKRKERKSEESRRILQERNSLSHRIIRQNISYEKLCVAYNENIKIGPTVVCISCSGLWFLSSIRQTSISTLIGLGVSADSLHKLTPNHSNNEAIRLCITCYRELTNGKLPKLSEANGLSFRECPQQLRSLTQLEERLVSPRIPFMQIRSLGVDKQYGLIGNVVNVPINMDTSISVLPRMFDQTFTIQLMLKRMIKHKSHFIYESVRPAVCYEAAKYLIQQPLYKSEGVILSDCWEEKHTEQNENFIVNNENNNNEENSNLNNKDDDWDETVNDQSDNVTTNDTLLQDSSAISFAPGEGRTPMSLLKDKFAEELSFPSIYCGYARNNNNEKVSYVDICKWELRNKDRRCCNIAKIFFMFKKRQIQMLTDQISLHLRKTKNTRNINAGQLLDKNFVDDLCIHDDCYKFLRADRASPVYWEDRKREVLAMIRQIGIPTLFLTLSSAETKWPELLIILSKVINGNDICKQEAEQMSYTDKCELIRKDPVTCARYFDKRIRELFSVLSAPNGPFGKYVIVDHYIRVEFQHRGSPHVHCLIWLYDAPKYIAGNTESLKNCIDFINTFITSSSDDATDDLVALQTHRHSFSCKKFDSGKRVCRFSFPHFPMPTTHILVPLENTADKEIYHEKYHRMFEFLSKIDKDSSFNLDATFEQFLSMIEMSYSDYICALRSKLKGPKVYIKRELKDKRINAFNKHILPLHRANIDIQFILDAYSCVQYILNYLNKSNRGMSKLLREAVEEVKAGNISIREQFKHIGNRYLKATEISSQEAVYHLLSMQVSRGSRSHAFINTGEIDKRVKIVKDEKELNKLAATSTEICKTGLLEHYINRPNVFNELCLADFTANFDYFSKRPNKRSLNKDNNTELNDDENVIDSYKCGEYFELRNNDGYIVARNRPKIIRYRRYNLKQDEQNYYREQCMLYVPWINEDCELINCDIRKKFIDNKEIISSNSAKYIHNGGENIEELFKEAEHCLEEEEQNSEQHEYSVYSIDQDKHYNVGQDISGDLSKPTIERFLPPSIKPDEEYFKVMRSLNKRQRCYTMEILHLLKEDRCSINHVIIGGAGVGKSTLITAIHQSLLRLYNSIPGANPDTIKVLLAAPTGKAAFNIGGMTLHTTFSLPVSQNRREIKNLSDDLRNNLASKLHDLKLVIIDEISMVSATMMSHVDHRLREITRCDELFGGISIICFGDFHQLRPVKDRFVFQCDDSNKYSALFENFYWENFRAFELTEIMRQKDDRVFAIALNNLATGECTDKDIELFKSRQLSSTTEHQPVDAIRLFRTNNEVNEYNINALNNIASKEEICLADDDAIGDVTADIKHYALKVISNMPTQKTYGLPSTITFKEGAKYMITVNINVEDGLVNGANGILRKIITVNSKVVRVWIEFYIDSVGRETRRKYAHIVKRGEIGNNWTPVETVSREIPVMKNQSVRVRRTQFPLISAEALTIAKSQGQTYESVVVTITRNMQRAELYVALSRARTSAGLYIIGDFYQPRTTPTVEIVELELHRLRTEATIGFKLSFLDDNSNNDIKILFHNVQSLQKHISDINCDPNYMAADVLCLVETWAIPDDRFVITGFTLIHQTQAANQRRPSGCSVLSKVSATFIKEYVFRDEEHSQHIEAIAFSICDTALIVIYNSPKNSVNNLMQCIRELMDCLKQFARIIVVGDFNININNTIETQAFIQYMNEFGLSLRNNIGDNSTNGYTQLDLLFSSNDNIQIRWYESYFSYHKPFFFTISGSLDIESLAINIAQNYFVVMDTYPHSSCNV